MRALITCSACDSDMPANARFCPACGEPGASVAKLLRRDAQETGIPYEEFLQAAKAADADEASSRETIRQIGARLTVLEQRLTTLAERLPAAEPSAQAQLEHLVDVPAAHAVTPPESTSEGLASVELPLPGETVPDSLITSAAEPDATSVAASAAGSVKDLPVTDPIAEEPMAPPPPATPWQPPAAARSRTTRTSRIAELESIVSGQGLAWIGGLAVLIGAVFFMSLAFNRGWVGPGTRVLIGVLASTAMILGGAWFFERREATFGHVLVAVGLGTMSLSMVAATRLYDLIPVELGLLGSLLSALLAAGIAIRFNLQVVAGYGIVAALAATLVLDADPNGTTIAFLAMTLAGSTVIALYRTWRWLPPLAFVLSIVQFINWVAFEPDTGTEIDPLAALAALGGFWLLHAIASGGIEIRLRRTELDLFSALLLFANAAFALIAGLAILENEPGWRGAFLLAFAAAHGLLGAYFALKLGYRQPFGELAFAIGYAALFAAVAVQFDGVVVPIVWSGMAVVLAWAYRRLRRPLEAFAAAVLSVLTVVHFIALEYPLNELTVTIPNGTPFWNLEGLALAAALCAAAAVGVLLPDVAVRRWLVAAGGAVIAYALPFELTGWALVAGWALIASVMAWLMTWRPLSPHVERTGRDDSWLFVIDEFGRFVAMQLVAVVTMSLAIGHVIFVDFPPAELGAAGEPTWPFLHAGGAALLCVLAALGVIARTNTSSSARRLLVTLTFGLLIYVMPFEFSNVSLIAAWSVLAVAALALEWRAWLPRTELDARTSLHSHPSDVEVVAQFALYLTAILAWCLTAAHLITIDYPVHELTAASAPDHSFLTRDGLSLAISLFALLAMSAITRSAAWHNGALAAGCALIAYSMPFELSGLWLVLGWSIVMAVTSGADRAVRPAVVDGVAVPASPLTIVAVAVSVLAAGHLLAIELPLDQLGDPERPATPFVDRPTLATLCFAIAALFASVATPLRVLRAGWRIAACLAVAYLMPFEVGPAAMAVAWSGIALAALLMGDGSQEDGAAYRIAAGGLLAAALVTTLVAVAPPERLFVDRQTVFDRPFLWSGATAALGALALALEITRRRLRTHPRSGLLAVLAGTLVVYLLSVGIVDYFQGELASTVDFDSLAKRAQVALSILWAVLGGAIFVAGTVRFGTPVRLFGLGLLSLATAKVFIWDLSTLTTSYRVLSFIGLGTLLLVSSYFYQRWVGHGTSDRDRVPGHGASGSLSI